jgi:hypothetical protein
MCAVCCSTEERLRSRPLKSLFKKAPPKAKQLSLLACHLDSNNPTLRTFHKSLLLLVAGLFPLLSPVFTLIQFTKFKMALEIKKALIADPLDATAVQLLQNAGISVDVRTGLKPDQLRQIVSVRLMTVH